jgi:hypothetical protein
MNGELTRVRVLEHRALSLNEGEGVEAVSSLYNAGDELELPANEAVALAELGFVEPVAAGSSKRRIADAETELE